MSASRSILPLVGALCLGLLTACSSSNSAGGTASSLTGTAATGLPLIGLITGKDKFGQVRRTQTDSTGKFTLDTTGLTPPIMIEATPANGGTPLYSFSDTGGGITVNVTPLTNLAVFLSLGNKSPRDLFQDFSNRNSELTETKITDAQKVINKNLQSQFQARNLDPTSFDFFNEAFDANQQGFDAVLDGISVSLPTRDGQPPIFRIPGTPGFSFNPSIDVSDINLSPGAPGTSGPGGPSGANESPATIESHAAGTFNFFFNPRQDAPSTPPFSSGQAVSFVVGTDGTLSFDGKTLSNPFLLNGNPAEAIWRDPASGLWYALSSINRPGTPPHEINLSMDGTFNTFLGQFNDTAPGTTQTQNATINSAAAGTYTGTFAPSTAPPPSFPFNSGASLTVTVEPTGGDLTVNDGTTNKFLSGPINRLNNVSRFNETIAIWVDGDTEYHLHNAFSGTVMTLSFFTPGGASEIGVVNLTRQNS